MSNDSEELSAIHDRYARRTRTYEPWEPWVWKSRQELEAGVIRLLRQRSLLPANESRVLEVGCGAGANLQMFLKLGFKPECISGIELQESRARAASKVLPAGATVKSGDACEAEFHEHYFDIVFQSLVFTSILDEGMQHRLAQRMRALVRPGGGILWYDFVYNNPSNPDVRGVSLAKVRSLFPNDRVYAQRITLAPPLSRFVTRIWPGCYELLNCVPLLRTHVLCWIDVAGAPQSAVLPEEK